MEPIKTIKDILNEILTPDSVIEELDAEIIQCILTKTSPIENTYLSFVREPSTYDEVYTDAVLEMETPELGTIFVHLEEIQYFNSNNIDDLIIELDGIFARISTKISILESKIYENQFDHITAENFQDHIKQGNIITQKLFDRLSVIFDKDYDPYDRSGLTFDFDIKE